MTDAERQAALEAIAAEIRACTRCRLHQGRSNAVPGEGNAATEVLFVGEGPGFNEDRQGRPFVGRAGDKLTEWIGSIGWRRDDVFITNIVKCRPPDNRDPLPDEIAACTPYLRRQIEALDPAVVVTLGRFSMGWFTPGTRITQVHGTARLADPSTGAPGATAYAMYHPAAALRSPEVDRQAADDMIGVPLTLIAARERRARTVADPPPKDGVEAEQDGTVEANARVETHAAMEEGETTAESQGSAATPTATVESVAPAAAPTATAESEGPAEDPVATPQPDDVGHPQPDTAAWGRLPSMASDADRPSVPSPMPPAAQGPGPRADDVPSDQLTLF